MNKNNKNLLIIIRLITFLFKFKSSDIIRFVKDFNSLRTKSGIKYAIKYMKTARLHVTRYICNKPLKVNNDLVSLTKDYFPKRFLYLKKYIDDKNNINYVNNIRACLTLLYYTRSVKATTLEMSKIKPNFNSIIDPPKVNRFYTIPSWFIQRFVEKHGLKSDIPTYSRDSHYISAKSSPYGKSTWNSTYELFSLSNIHHNRLNHYIKIMSEEVYMKVYGNLIKNTWIDNRLFSYIKEPKCSGSLSIINDPELKQRVIAMSGYTTQLLLKPIHDNLLNMLKRFPQDRTFDQNPHNNWKPNGNSFHSLDLSSATDRFPLHLQTKLLSYMYNQEFALVWKDLLVDQSFVYDKIPYKYEVGQPMGSYSSWAAFTLTHHLVVEWSAYLTKNWNFSSYILLGDDIVINNDQVANKYKTIMTKLGVEISEAKSHVSFNTYEFAKRWIYKGIEISPLPLKGIMNNFNNLPVVLMQLINYRKNINDRFKGNALELISLVYNNIFINKRFLTKSSINNICYKFYHSYRYSLGLATELEMRSFLIRLLPEHIPVPNEKLIHGFIRELLIKTLTFQVEGLASSASKSFQKFIDIYENKKLDDFKMLKDHPFVHALYNSLNNKKMILTNVNDQSNIDLINTIIHMRLEDVDKLVETFRNPYVLTKKLDKLWDESKLKLKKINLEFESHWDRAPLLDGNTPSIDHKYFATSISTCLGKFDVFRYGIYDKPGQSQCMW
jgi:hypothetical protein